MVTSRGMTYLGESELEVLDWVDIETADVTLNPYDWVVSGKSGRKAYLQSLFIKIEEDYLQEKWTQITESKSKWDEFETPAELKQLEGVIIDGEYEEVDS
jgi:hypothetical protein